MLSESILAIKTIRENTTYVEFDQLLQFLKKANDLGIVDEFIDELHQVMNIENSDLTSALQIVNFEILEK
jgi:hypothetical protein